MNDLRIEPPLYLKPYVQYFWVLESNAAGNSAMVFRPIPDGCPGLFFQQADRATVYDQDRKQLPELFLYGQTVMHRELHSNGPIKALGICLYPHALNRIFGLDAHELTDTCVDVKLLANKSGYSLSAQLTEATSTSQQIEFVAAYLWQKIRSNSAPADAATDYALAQLLTSRGSVPLKKLQETLRLSERSFERKFRQSVGISPKLFSRICRFQSSLDQLRNSSYDRLSDVAFDNGYADQSHFIRVFKEFTGLSPYQFQKQANEVIENLTEWAS